MTTIISASRRTDVPAFYSDWFMNRLHDGYVRWLNPFSGKPAIVSLKPEDVAAIVFWSKNYLPLMPHLDELDSRGYKTVFQFTITGLPKLFEPRVPDLPDLLNAARILCGRYSPERVLWRYDPILISDRTDIDYHIVRFREIAGGLEGITRRCYFSFAIFYPKVLRSLGGLPIKPADIAIGEQLQIVEILSEIAANYGIEMYSCCGDHLVNGRIKNAHCVDAELLHRLFPDSIGSFALRPTRKECGCFESKDIGAYDTCPHGCTYCYANSREAAALRYYERHDPCRDMLAVGLPCNNADPPDSKPATNCSLSFDL